ncbi:hypothetical protein ACJJTC_007619 [Scirpophaga incertulas]
MSEGGMASPLSLCLLFASVSLLCICHAGPLGPLPNATSTAIGVKEECEQDGRVYGNGEKLVDPKDPCRVCYCQGGEVVCRRIACFVRDDCQPRQVPGRCCPEYDNCPLRGVTTVASLSATASSISLNELDPSSKPQTPIENIKQEITIKEITPVSEIPVLTDVRIKEILPSPSIEVAEYSSSKAPLIPREVTSEKIMPDITDRPVIIEIHPSSSPVIIPSSPPKALTSPNDITESKRTHDQTPSKISLSTQDSINSEIYPSKEPSVGTIGPRPSVHEIISVTTTTKSSVVLEEDDASLFDHNPAFPPIPDDLSVLSNHEDDINSESTMDGDHLSSNHEVVKATSTLTEAPSVIETLSTTLKDTTESPKTSLKNPESTTGVSARDDHFTTISASPKQNLRSAIPTEMVIVSSIIPENGQVDKITKTPLYSEKTTPVITTTENIKKTDNISLKELYTTVNNEITSHSTVPSIKILEVTTPENVDLPNPKNTDEQSFISTAKSNTATEITGETEFSSLPIETSDQNPHDETSKDRSATSSVEPTLFEAVPTKLTPTETEVITVSRGSTSNTDNQSLEHVETTEFVLTSFGSSESATDTVEIVKISPKEVSAPLIESDEKKKESVLTDLINLVGDVASISDHTDTTSKNQHVTSAPSISESEELILVNSGYKSKNNNWNINSITEIAPKNKHPVNKQKVIEIEDDDTDGITDASPPYDKIEPTTRRPIIDNVSDDMHENKTDAKDIEIIKQTYVPTVSRRPTKVVMKKNNEKPIADDNPTDISASVETATEIKLSESSEINTSSPVETTDNDTTELSEGTTLSSTTQ